MTYPIWIWTDGDGRPHIGANGRESSVSSEQIYSSQMRHRVTARRDGVVCIMTPTEAAQEGWEVIHHFPAAIRR